MEALVSVVNLKKYFPLKSSLFGRVVGYIRAVDDVTLQINSGETLGLVGESGRAPGVWIIFIAVFPSIKVSPSSKLICLLILECLWAAISALKNFWRS